MKGHMTGHMKGRIRATIRFCFVCPGSHRCPPEVIASATSLPEKPWPAAVYVTAATIADLMSPVSVGQLSSWWQHNWMEESLSTIAGGVDQLEEFRDSLLDTYPEQELILPRHELSELSLKIEFAKALRDRLSLCYRAISQPESVSHPVTVDE